MPARHAFKDCRQSPTSEIISNEPKRKLGQTEPRPDSGEHCLIIEKFVLDLNDVRRSCAIGLLQQPCSLKFATPSRDTVMFGKILSAVRRSVFRQICRRSANDQLLYSKRSCYKIRAVVENANAYGQVYAFTNQINAPVGETDTEHQRWIPYCEIHEQRYHVQTTERARKVDSKSSGWLAAGNCEIFRAPIQFCQRRNAVSLPNLTVRCECQTPGAPMQQLRTKPRL